MKEDQHCFQFGENADVCDKKVDNDLTCGGFLTTNSGNIVH